jgi:hypothetical protein
MSKVALGFVPEPLLVPIDRILPSRKAPVGLASSRKYRQIQTPFILNVSYPTSHLKESPRDPCRHIS